MLYVLFTLLFGYLSILLKLLCFNKDVQSKKDWNLCGSLRYLAAVTATLLSWSSIINIFLNNAINMFCSKLSHFSLYAFICFNFYVCLVPATKKLSIKMIKYNSFKGCYWKNNFPSDFQCNRKCRKKTFFFIGFKICERKIYSFYISGFAHITNFKNWKKQLLK